MDYFQGVVTEYLRADRSVFVNTECLIQLDEGDKQIKDRHWFCDAMAVNFRESTVYLCEITYSASMQALASRLAAWHKHWPEVVHAIKRDSKVPAEWLVRPWVFIPEKRRDIFLTKTQGIRASTTEPCQMPAPRLTYLEAVVPWEYRTWDRKSDAVEHDA